MKREELTPERQKQLNNEELINNKHLTEEQIDEFNNLCDESEKCPNKLKVSVLEFAQWRQRWYKLFTNLSIYRDPDDEHVLADEQILKRLYVSDLCEHKRQIEHLIMEIDDELDCGIGDKNRLEAKTVLRKEIKSAEDKFKGSLPYSIFDDFKI